LKGRGGRSSERRRRLVGNPLRDIASTAPFASALLVLELVHVPAAGAHRRAHRERRVLGDFGGEILRHFEVAALRRKAVDDAGCEGFFPAEPGLPFAGPLFSDVADVWHHPLAE
jgi:hypothetical protein